MDETRIYRDSVLGRAFSAIVASALLLVCLRALLVSDEISAIPLAFGAVCYLAVFFRSRIEVDQQSIRDVGVFGAREFALTDIAGYRLVPGRRGRHLVFKMRDGESLSVFPHPELVAWAAERFSDLDLEADRDEFERALASDELGSNETERLDTIEEARKWAVYLNVGAGLAAAWVVFFPAPLKLALAVVVTLPVLALTLIKRYKGAVLLVGTDQGMLPSVFLVFLIPIPALATRAALDWTVVSWGSFWLPFATLTGILFWCALRLARPWERSSLLTFILAVVCPVYGYGSVMSVNHIFDFVGATSYQPQVLAKKIDGVRRPSRMLALTPWGPPGSPSEVHAPRGRFEDYEVGDTVTIHLWQGALGITYYQIQ